MVCWSSVKRAKIQVVCRSYEVGGSPSTALVFCGFDIPVQLGAWVGGRYERIEARSCGERWLLQVLMRRSGLVGYADHVVGLAVSLREQLLLFTALYVSHGFLNGRPRPSCTERGAPSSL